MQIDAILLAAGLSTRMGTNKLLLPYHGKPLLGHALALIASLPFFSRILVTRPATLAGVLIPENFRTVFNHFSEQGQALSMRLALEQAKGDGYLFFQGDQPLLDAATVNAVLALAGPDTIVAPAYQGRPGTPVFFPRRFREELLAVSGDQGGRSVRDNYPESCCFVPVSNPAILLDVDTREQYEALRRGQKPERQGSADS